MIQGVHAETIVFRNYEQAHSLVVAREWASLGSPSEFGGRDLKLHGTRPRRFRMHITDVRPRTKTISCQLELHDGDRLFAPLIKAELTFAAEGQNTRISLAGSTARDLAPSSSTQRDASRALANEYVRALLDQMAKAIENQAIQKQTPVRRRPSQRAATVKRDAVRHRAAR